MAADFSKELDFAKRLAVAANKISDKYYKSSLNFKTKGDDSPVTIADETINTLVINEVKKEFPDSGVLGEEESWQPDKDKLWVCDPIDGTIAFSMGDPVFTFSLALVIKGRPVVAVTRELANGHMYWAIAGSGAYVDNNRIYVSKRKLSTAWLALPTELSRLYNYRSLYEPLANAAYQVNVIHGAVFKGMLIAQGLADGNVLPARGNPWDFAAVKLIVEEAGGQVTDINGSDQLYNKELNGVVLSNGIIHQDLLRFIQEANLS